MTKEEAKEYLMNISYQLGTMGIEYLNEKDGIKMREAIKILEQEPCEDCITRQSALDAIKNFCNECDADYCGECRMNYPGKDVRNVFESLPLVTPQLKVGKWITVDKGLIVTSYKCSECGRTVRDDTGYDVTKDYPYCHCGARMQEVKE